MKRREQYNPLLKSYPESDKINEVSEGAEVLYVRLIAQSDDAGRYYGDPFWIAAKLFTARSAKGQVDAAEIGRRLDELESATLLKRYRAGSGTFLELIDVFKTLRRDVKPQILFPSPDTENVTDPLRDRNENGPLDVRRQTSDPDQDLEPDPDHIRASDVGALKKTFECDWDRARELAKQVHAKFGRCELTSSDRSLLLKMAALTVGERISEHRLWDSIEAVRVRYAKPDPPRSSQLAYWHGTLKSMFRDVGSDFNALLKSVKIPALVGTNGATPREVATSLAGSLTRFKNEE